MIGSSRAGNTAGAVIFLGAAGLAAGGGLPPEMFPQVARERPFLTVLLFLVLYALKSVTVFFPLLVLQATVGFLYPLPAALAINFAGRLVALSVPYAVGRRRGTKYLDKVLNRYPKLAALAEKQQQHTFYLCFVLRVISGLPGDVVTMYLGALNVPFWQNLLAGSLGILPGMIRDTMLGAGLEDPSSPVFRLALVLSVTLAGFSTLLSCLASRRQQKNVHE